MSQKSALKKRPERRSTPAKGALPVDQPGAEPEELTSAEQWIEDFKPHLMTIALVVVAVVLGFVSMAVWRSASFQSEAIKWTELNQAASINFATGDVKELTRIADDYSDSRAGLIGALYAADSQLRSGIEQLPTDRDGGLALVKQAKSNYQDVVDAPDEVKTTWISQNALYHLAYAAETLGEFGEAKAAYQELIDDAADSPLAGQAKRGLERCNDEDYVAMYKTFKEFKITEAPGPGTDPNRPGLDFDSLEGLNLPAGTLPPSGGNPPMSDESGQDPPPATEGGEGNPDPALTAPAGGDPSTDGDDKKSPSPPVTTEPEQNTGSEAASGEAETGSEGATKATSGEAGGEGEAASGEAETGGEGATEATSGEAGGEGEAASGEAETGGEGESNSAG